MDFSVSFQQMPFVPPTYPGTLVIPNTSKFVEALQLKDEHNELRCLCLEFKNIEKALQRHAQDALEDKHTTYLVDEFTNLITDNITTTLEHLFYNFGKISSEEVEEKESEIMRYDLEYI